MNSTSNLTDNSPGNSTASSTASSTGTSTGTSSASSSGGSSRPSFFIVDEDLQHINKYINSNPGILLSVPEIRYYLAHSRFIKTPKDKIRTLGNFDPAVIQNAVEHNMKGLEGGLALARPDQLINVVKSIDYVGQRLKEIDILSVGPRSEAEILGLAAAGFNMSKVRAIDLISYSPFVDLGDMHQLPYSDSSFDVILLGWVLGYSKQPKRVADETLRVAKKGAIVAIGCEYNPASFEELKSNGGVLEDDYPRYQNTDELLSLFEGRVRRVIFKDDVHPNFRDRIANLIVVFEIN